MGHKPRGGDDGSVLEMVILDVVTAPAEAGSEYYPVVLVTSRGDLALRHYHVRGARRGLVFAGGGTDAWDGPVGDTLYPRLCVDLARAGLAAVRVRYRQPGVLDECVLDVLAALHFLTGVGVTAAAVAGHGFGGAVALQAAAHAPVVRAVVTLATETPGPAVAGSLPRGCAALFAHGTADELSPIAHSRQAYDAAYEPKRLVLYEGAGHGLDEAEDELFADVRAWIVGHLPERRQPDSGDSGAAEPETASQ
jgi:pimeloyl-ACP methyl ester carboxylesterase